MGILVVQIILYIALIAGMMFALKKSMKYYQKKDNKFGKAIKIVEIAYISKDRKLMIVELQNKKYFLGVANNSFTLIKELDSENDKLQ